MGDETLDAQRQRIAARLSRREFQISRPTPARFLQELCGPRSNTRSLCGHARIVKIDAAAALKLSGVVGVLTSTDMPGLKTIPMRTGVIPGLERSQQTPIATTKVRYVGDPVAVVVAENRYIAEDALELIEVEYAPLGAVTDARAGMNTMAQKS